MFVTALVAGVAFLTSYLPPFTVSVGQGIDWNITLGHWERVSKIIQSGVTAVAIIVGGFWTYFTFIKGRTLKEQLEPKTATRIISRDGEKFLVATIQLKNTGKSIIYFKKSGTHLILFKYQPSAGGTAVTEKDWLFDYKAPSILNDHVGVEPNEQIEEPVLIPLEQADQQIYMVRLRIASKKTTWTADTILAGNPAGEELPASATSQSGKEKGHVS
jgi:hypothetical protein